jgi:GTP-binding protein
MIVLGAQFEKSAADATQAPPGDLPEVCFVGRSNVGKSSALNTLIHRRKLARVSKTPGRTRLLNFFRVELANHAGPGKQTAAMRFCDLPGYGFALAPKKERITWGKTISDYLAGRDALVAVVMLVDSEVGPQPRDHEMLEYLTASKRPLILMGTKADRLSRTRRGAAADRIARELGVPRAGIILYSSEEEIGHEELWDALCAAAGLFDRQSGKLLEPASPEAGVT